MPVFTVAIPTFNRAHFLRETIPCILHQSYDDFELVISDNASTDNTAELVEAFADKRIRYVRQPRNLGHGKNFAACLEMARGEWMVFNQSDDLLCPFFLERCARAIAIDPDLVMYAAEAVLTDNVAHHHHNSQYCSIPLAHHWAEGGLRLIPGIQVAALTWFTVGFVPPAMAARTALLRKHWSRVQQSVFTERMITTGIASEGTVAFDSYVGAMHRQHAGNLGASYSTADQRRGQEECWNAIGQFFAERGIDWQSALRAILPELPASYREQLLLQSAQQYADGQVIPREAVEILAEDAAAKRGVTPAALLEHYKAIGGPYRSRLDRLRVPRRLHRMIRGILYACGKQTI